MKKCLFILVVGLVLASDSPREYEDATVSGDQVYGVWKRSGLILDGNDLGAPDWVITLRDGKYSGQVGGSVETGTYRITGSGGTRRLEMVRTSDRSSNTQGQFLFRVEGDTLTMAYHNGAAARPET